MSQVLHIRGPVLRGPDDIVAEAWVVGGRMTYTAPVGAGEVTELRGWALPGLVDAHSHVGLDAHGPTSHEVAESHALADRDAGALLLRSPGNPADLSWMKTRDDMPRMVDGGRHIARPRRYIRGYGHEVEPEQLEEYVRMEARRSDGWVKLVGDWIDRERGDLAALWPPDMLAVAVAAAHEEGARVTAHCFASDALLDLAAAGVDCIEHATGLTDESIAVFAAQGIAIVPTLVNIAKFPDFAAAGAEKFPEYAQHMTRLHERRYRTVGAAHDAGIAIYCGTDAGGNIPHGMVPFEVTELMKAGLSAVEALDAACWSARRWLGFDALDEGADADLVLYDADPRDDPSVLHSPSAVVLRGVSV